MRLAILNLFRMALPLGLILPAKVSHGWRPCRKQGQNHSAVVFVWTFRQALWTWGVSPQLLLQVAKGRVAISSSSPFPSVAPVVLCFQVASGGEPHVLFSYLTPLHDNPWSRQSASQEARSVSEPSYWGIQHLVQIYPSILHQTSRH